MRRVGQVLVMARPTVARHLLNNLRDFLGMFSTVRVTVLLTLKSVCGSRWASYSLEMKLQPAAW
eukprot:COSAG01_NODE_7210_length_3304_cov_2.853354_2_plen_64_part_00